MAKPTGEAKFEDSVSRQLRRACCGMGRAVQDRPEFSDIVRVDIRGVGHRISVNPVTSTSDQRTSSVCIPPTFRSRLKISRCLRILSMGDVNPQFPSILCSANNRSRQYFIDVLASVTSSGRYR